jgi:hypothetical protein
MVALDPFTVHPARPSSKDSERNLGASAAGTGRGDGVGSVTEGAPPGTAAGDPRKPCRHPARRGSSITSSARRGIGMTRQRGSRWMKTPLRSFVQVVPTALRVLRVNRKGRKPDLEEV